MASKSSKSTKAAKPVLLAVPKDDIVAAQPAPAPAPAPSAAPPQIAIVSESDEKANRAAPKADALKMKELLTAVVTKTGAKKKDAKDVVDAALAEIAAALGAGKSLTLPPLGNLRIAKVQDKDGAKMMVLKLRMGGGDKGTKDPLAEDE